MPDNILDGQGVTLLTAIVIVAVALLALVGVFWLIRARSSSTFIRGGKNRMPRLAVLDATAVDTKRRLVLIRRDEVEHLVMIGGPTDIVIESRITQPDEERDAFAPPPRYAPPPPSAQPEWRDDRQPVEQFHQPSEPVAPPRQAEPAKPQPQPQPKSQPTPSSAKPRPAPSQITTAAAATGATIAATSIHAEAADVLESARNRVFEDPSFDETAFEELTIASGRVAPSPQTPAPSPTPAPATTPAPAQIKTPEPAPTMSPAPVNPPKQTPVQAPARAPTQTPNQAPPQAPNQAPPQAPSPAPAQPPIQAAPQSPPPVQWQRATPSAVAPQAPPQPAATQAQPPAQPTARAPGDFESVLAAELSDDLSLDLSDDSFFEPLDHETDFSANKNDEAPAPAAKTDKRPSRDSLEEEMERLLGDLAAK